MGFQNPRGGSQHIIYICKTASNTKKISYRFQAMTYAASTMGYSQHIFYVCKVASTTNTFLMGSILSLTLRRRWGIHSIYFMFVKLPPLQIHFLWVPSYHLRCVDDSVGGPGPGFRHSEATGTCAVVAFTL